MTYGVTAMNALNYLSKDHKPVNQLMQKLVNSKDVRERANLFAVIKDRLAKEAMLEEQALAQAFQAVRQRGAFRLWR